jgi:HD domain-containing protein
MDLSQFNALQHWFDAFVTPFCDTDPEGLRNIRLKIEHTRKVCDNMHILATGEGLSSEEGLIAASVALLHDVGRFPQYRRWRTFRDSESDNHARLGIEVLRLQGVLDELPVAKRLLIEEAVRFHNLLAVPQQMKSSTSPFLSLIRDADKLDIWRVFLDYFRQPEDLRPSAVTLGFPDLPEVTPACLGELAAGRVIRLEDVRVLNDFKLLLISWVFDLNFSTSYRLLDDNNYLHDLALLLPDRDDIRSAINSAQKHIAMKMAGFSP